MLSPKPTWKENLSWSNAAFKDLVWPKLEPQIQGTIIHVETATDSALAKEFDTLSGIDAWHIHTSYGIRGIASRVQECDADRPYDTFTVRKSKTNGAKTEYQKRLEAIDSDMGWLYPAITVQAYITDKYAGDLISFGVCYTYELIRHIQWQGDKALVQRTYDAEFYVVPFSDIAIYQWHDGN